MSENTTSTNADRASEVAKQVSSLFLLQLGSCAYSALTIASTQDSALILNTATTNLPVVQTPVPMAYFYSAVALLLPCVFLYFQFTLQSLWEEISEIPLLAQDGSSRAELGRAWLIAPFIDDQDSNSALKSFRKYLTAICIWATVPITNASVWWRYLSRHDFFGSVLQGICLVASCWTAITFYLIGRNTLSFEKLRRLTGPQKGWLALLTPIALCLVISASYYGFRFRHADLRNANLSNANLAGLDLRNAEMSGANLSAVNFDRADLRGAKIDRNTSVSPKWRRVFCLFRTDPFAETDPECAKLVVLAWADLSGVKMSGLDLRGVSFVGADLRHADLSGTLMNGSDLRLADLSDALLPDSPVPVLSDGALGLDARWRNDRKTAPLRVALQNRMSKACITEPLPPKDYSRLITSRCDIQHLPALPWLMKNLGNGFFSFTGALSKDSSCLDSSAYGDGAPVQMWSCATENDTQSWHLQPMTPAFVQIAEAGGSLCINGSTRGSALAAPFLRKCDEHDHEQQWHIALPQVPDAVQIGLIALSIDKQRQRDAARAAREYSVAPGQEREGYGSSSGRDRHRYGWEDRYMH